MLYILEKIISGLKIRAYAIICYLFLFNVKESLVFNIYFFFGNTEAIWLIRK